MLEKLVLLSPETLAQRHQPSDNAHASAGAGGFKALHISIGRGCVMVISLAAT